MGLTGPFKYGEYFHELYTNRGENRKSVIDKRPKEKPNRKDEKRNENLLADQIYPTYSVAQIELEPNVSKFAVFAAIRSAVLEVDTKYALFHHKNSKKSTQNCCCTCIAVCKGNELTDCQCHTGDKKARDDVNSDAESETEEVTEKEVVVKVPQIVEAGLRSLFELISDARNVQPNLCTKALKALFDVIQGQQPESFKNEPDDLINPLYELLLQLASFHGPMASDNTIVGGYWSSIACSALLGLCVARGDTGKILKAITALLMSPKLLSAQAIHLPLVLSSLQRTVICAILNKPTKPEFHSHGVPKNSLIDEFSLRSALASYINYNTQPAMVSDGKYLYLLVDNCLLKVGTGFNGTYKGHVYNLNSGFGKDKSGWLGYCGGKLYYKRLSRRNNDSVLVVNTDTLAVVGNHTMANLPTREGQNYVLFADEDSINAICSNKDDTLVVRQLFSANGTQTNELVLKLARKKFRTLGYAAFEDEVLNQNQIQKIQSSYNMFEPKLPNDVEIQSIVCGKEFGLVRASNGKIYYYGKSASLGLKSVGRTPTMKMTELIISKVSNITQIAIGHDGIHALLVNDDGTVYFAGTARRGEDGDTSKNRRQPKASKPKKLSRVDGHVVTQAACNNGTSAFVTKSGKLIMFGKDAAHCDSMGFVTDLQNEHITKIAVGKAHCVAVNSKGQLFTFGLNNKGQCGRVFAKEREANISENDAAAGGSKPKLDFSNMCDVDDHVLIQGQCRVCSVCKECTGYNVSCVSSLNVSMEDRVAGSLCPCGHGDAGCSKCGACSFCISTQESEINGTKESKQITLINRQRSKSLILRKKEKKNEEGNTPSDVERDTPRVAPLAPQKVPLSTSSPVVQIACGLHHTVVLTLAGEVFTFGSNQYGQLGTGDLQPVLGPFQVKVQGQISQIAAGSNHTVLLTSKGVVYTFGNYQKGQLGRLPNDFPRNPLLEESSKDESSSKDNSAANILSQRQKFLWNCSPGTVFGLGPSFGKKATWVGASGDQTFIKIDESLITPQMLPKVNIVAGKKTILLIPTISLSFHVLTINRRDGNCIAHYNNQVNFVRIIQANACSMPEINQNINANMNQDQMSRSAHEIRNQIFELQENHNSLAEQRKRRRQEHKSPSEKPCPQIAFALDPHFDVLWVFDGGARKIMYYNVLASQVTSNPDSNFRSILSPELALSQKQDSSVTRLQASLNLLACLDILTSAQDAIPNCFDQTTPQQTNLTKESQSNEYQIVNRFENFGGGWGYSGHSVEAIRFMVDTDVMICGFGMFGGRGEYTCKLKLFDLGIDGGNYEKDGILISETKDIPYECPARNKYHIMLPKPVCATASHWYLVWARIAGPSSDCGSSGQGSVTTEDQIVFNFKSSKKANNGTDVNSGQIPSIIYRLITPEAKQTPLPVDIDPVHKVSKCFANTVTKECFDSLVLLLNWSWEAFKGNLREHRDKTKQLQVKNILDHLVYVNKFSLRLLRKYSNEIYPQKLLKSAAKKSNESAMQVCNASKNLPTAPRVFIGPNDTPAPVRKSNTENIQLAECIGNVRAMLIQILCDDIFRDVSNEDGYKMAVEILDECHRSFVACFDAFYPTSSLKWNCLCDLLSQMDKGIMHSRFLSAILAGLCNPSVKLRSTFSLLTPGNERQSIISPSDNAGLPMLSSTENHQYPILVEQMIYRTQQEKIDFLSNSWTFKDVLLRLLDIISSPIKVKIENVYNRSCNFNESKLEKDINQGLIDNCSQLLAKVLAEIVYQNSSEDFDTTFMPPRILHSTGSRFARVDTSRTWNTGNFGPDAIGFSVDRPGIAIAGAMVYTGTGSYEYQLELLYDNTNETQSHHKWETLESVSGSYDQDIVQNDMAEIKFERPVHIKENGRYALRLCSQGARTCSGDGGTGSIRGPCGTIFTFNTCDLSFNGTTTMRGQIPCILYYSTPVKSEGNSSVYTSEITARDTALQIATDITKKCTELLILARNALAASLSPSDKSPNSSNHTQTIDSEHNITPIEEHIDVTWANNSRHSVTQDGNLSTARDITKRLESFSKGIMETLKFDKRSTNPFDFEIEIGATEIHPKDLIEESELNEKIFKNGRMTKYNGNDRMNNSQEHPGYLKEMGKSDSEESTQLTIVQLLELFNMDSSNMFHTLLPSIYAHIGALACNDPKSSIQVLTLIKELLPHVAALNQLYASKEMNYQSKDENHDSREDNADMVKRKTDEVERTGYDMCTTSNHYCIVESEHPYKSATLNTFRVEFPPCVQWMTVEFDNQCGTAQMEDYLLLSIPSKPQKNVQYSDHEDFPDILDNNACWMKQSCKNASVFSSYFGRSPDGDKDGSDKYSDSDWIIIKKFNTPSNWSQKALVLPGNKIEFSLETASFYAQDQQANKFGFKALVIGYDNPITLNISNACLIRLEYELSYLGGMCSANLMKKDLNLPDDKSFEDLTCIEDTIASHSSLLSKGLALSDSVLTVNQALDTQLSVGSQSNERQFLKDFISGAPGSSGARLAAWLQPEPRLDPNKCELNPIPEPIRYGFPTKLTVTIRDQYGDIVIVPELKVEIKAIPAGSVVNGNKKGKRTTGIEPYSLFGVVAPPRNSYEPTFKDKMCFKAITFMKAYAHYSFEELRFFNPLQTRITETLHAQDKGDGTFGVAWVPSSVGNYCLTVNIDGIALEEIYRVEVKEGAIPPPSHKPSTKKPQPPNRLRKFVTKNSAGLRIRSHPTLQSEQIGIVKMNGVISFIDEIENDDGVWVRLSTESIRQHCTAGWYPTEAWCLQYNQHLGKTLLHPIVEHSGSRVTTTKTKQKNVPDTVDNNSTEPQSKVKTGSPKKGYDFSSAKFTPPLSSDSGQSSGGTNPFIFTSSNNAKTQDEKPNSAKDLNEFNLERSNDSFNQMFDTQSSDEGSRQSHDISTQAHTSNQSNIGSAFAGVVGGGAIKLQALQKWFKGDSVENKDSGRKRGDITDIASVSVRDLVRAIGSQETKSNGNSGTPPQISRSSSPVFVPPIKYPEGGASVYSSSSKSVEVSDASILASSLTRDLSQSLSQSSMKEEISASSKITDSHTSQSDGNATAIRLTGFSLGASCSSIGSPKHSPRKLRSKRAMSPANYAATKDLKASEVIPDLNVKIDQASITATAGFDSKSSSASTDNMSPPVWPSSSSNQFGQATKMSNINEEKLNHTDPTKRAMPPSFAESLRAVFAAFLWHEGLVHDAMACASFLKFYPSLPKEGALVVTRRDTNEGKVPLSREQKAQQRHSVEVANAGNYLNIRPSTLETLTKSGNSSLNNRRYRKNAAENENSDKPKLQTLPEVVAVLPPALRCLVYLWEQLCSNCIQIVQSSTIDPQKPSSPRHQQNGKDKLEVSDKDVKKIRKKKKDDGTWCELCEVFLPIPVTYHMRIVHPGCGKSAKGKGYNSVGIFCEGWAGNCGEGGKGASSWFLMCDACREKYMTIGKNTNISNCGHGASSADLNLFGIKATCLIANSEVYTTMKDNATFLLELSSSTSSLLTNQKRSPQQMPIVTEDQLNLFTDMNRPSTSRGDSIPNSNRNSRIGLKINGKFNGMASTPHRKSSVFPPCVSPELMWQAPDAFSCLESLGASMNDDLPYEIFGLNSAENCFDRPLSEMSFDSCDPNNSELMTHSTTHATNTLSRFHRSYSMGQGWSGQQNFGVKNYYQQPDDQPQSKVVLRRRINSTSDSDCSLLLCYPSENLRKLVPENILSTSCIVQPSNKLQSSGETEPSDLASTQTQTSSKPTEQKEEADSAFTENDKKPEDVASNDKPKDCIFNGEMEINTNCLLSRPAMSFITQQHDLEKLRYFMKRSLRIATCRIYSLQALNWLIRSVTQPVCLHDLMWWFVAALSNSHGDDGLKLDETEYALEHPVSSTQMSGRISQVLSQSLHTFLQSVADLTLLLPAGSSLQRIAIQCFAIRFRQADHQFLHSSHVFGNISKILSKSDEQNEAMLVSSSLAMGESNSHGLEHNFNNQLRHAGASIWNYTELNGMFEITVSSRQAMADSLTDNSTETFWESDEEDRNKCKIIEISMNRLNNVCKYIFVHIDNSRDVQHKVLNVVFFAGQSLGDTSLIRTVDIDAKACTWISAKVPDESFTHFRLEFRGPENTLRVRQIKLLGLPSNMEELHIHPKLNSKVTNPIQIQQMHCEAETLRVFRLITAQVFGKLISSADHRFNENINLLTHPSVMESSANSLLADSLDLREHMVGILFSRSKLSHLQKQVIVHIVHAIKKEAQRAKEEWELSNASGAVKDVHFGNDQKSDSSSDRFRLPDTYCFEMLSMVLALSGSAVGRSYLSHQHGLLKDLLSLLHTGSDRVQRQVTSLLRRILPEITPENFADILGVPKMPPTDFNIVNQSATDFDLNRFGILDIFLAVIAKSLQLQVKVKTNTKTNTDKTSPFVKLCNSVDLCIHLLKSSKKPDESVSEIDEKPNVFGANVRTVEGNNNGFEIIRKKQKDSSTKNLNQRWFMKGSISIKQAESIISLIKDMTNGKLSEKWSTVTKAAIAETILNLTRLDEIFRTPENCIKTATLWLALASLCVLDKEHVEKLSSGQWSKVSDTRPLCNNHDDGETPAVIQCENCGSLCGDCDRYLHLNRKTRTHRRTVCKEEEEAIRVELHESCGRTKLFWLLALADSRTLKGMVEFRDGSNTVISGPQETVGRCRFCGVTGNSGLLEIGNVCAELQCQEHAANACSRIKSCGHICGGVAGEQKCLPCLQLTCHERENQNAESLKEPKLTQDADDMCMICFEALSYAPSIQLDCGHVFHHHCCKMVLEKRWTGPRITFRFSQCPICESDIQHPLLVEILEPINALKADVRRKAVMRLKYDGIAQPDGHKDLAAYAMARYAYYVCFKCQKAYYGGEARCDAEAGENFDPQELVCGGCSDVAAAQMCAKHGTDFLEYKCRYCCSVAVFFCFGTTHFCDTCHDDFQRLTNIPKNKLPQCPAGPKAKQLLGEECPLHLVHPPTGEEFALGCGICRNAQTF